MHITYEDWTRYQKGEIRGEVAELLFLQNYAQMSEQERHLLNDQLERERINDLMVEIQARKTLLQIGN